MPTTTSIPLTTTNTDTNNSSDNHNSLSLSRRSKGLSRGTAATSASASQGSSCVSQEEAADADNTVKEQNQLHYFQSIQQQQQQQQQMKQRRQSSIKFLANTFVTVTHQKSALDCLSCNAFEEHYEILHRLGEGAYGEVYVCRHLQTQVQRAVKILTVHDPISAERVLSEFHILKNIDHPNLLKIYQLYIQEETTRHSDYFDDTDRDEFVDEEEEPEDTTTFYIVTDLYQGGELYEELEEWGYLEEDDVALLMNSLLSCINYCHAQGICHRDLKPENILLADDEGELADLKVIDFGLAALMEDTNQVFTERVGSSYYLAPQVLEGSYTCKCDIWSCGVIAFVLLCGEAPFDGDTDEDILEAVALGEFNFKDNELWEEVSDEAKDFVSWLLSYDEQDRPSAEQALQHAWLQETRQQRTSSLVESSFSNHQRQQQQQDEEDGDDSTNNSNSSIYKEYQTYLMRLKDFSAQSKLKQAVCSFISSQLILKQEKDVIDELFRALDTECDGRLTRQELQAGFQLVLPHYKLSDSDINDIFQSVNYSDSGFIEYSEFVVACIQLDNTRLWATFKEFDKSGRGELTPSDLRQALHVPDSYNVDKIMRQIDTDRDGSISFAEFQAAMTKKHHNKPVTALPSSEKQAMTMMVPKPSMVRRKTTGGSLHGSRLSHRGLGGSCHSTSAAGQLPSIRRCSAIRLDDGLTKPLPSTDTTTIGKPETIKNFSKSVGGIAKSNKASRLELQRKIRTTKSHIETMSSSTDGHHAMTAGYARTSRRSPVAT